MKADRMGRVLATSLAVIALASCGRGEADVGETGPQQVAVERRDLEVRAEAAGTVEPIRVVEVKSKASGEVLRLHAETGDLVQRGALLAEIDPRDVRNSFLQAQADLEVARVRLETAQAQRERAEELRKANVVTEQEYETAVEGAANARASLVRAETNLQLARERMGDVAIGAPISGMVIQRQVEEGQIVASATSNISGGSTLMLMADLSEMQVRALVDETDIGRIQPGQPAIVSVEAFPNRQFRGRVLKIEPQAVIEQNVTMFPVLVRLENRDGLLKPGMNAEVRIDVAVRNNVLTVPNGAVVSMRDMRAAAAALGLDDEALRADFAGGQQQGGANAGPPARGQQGPRAQPAAAQRADGARRRGGARDGGGAARDGAGAAPAGVTTRPGILFVVTPQGVQPRRVTLGVSDWEYTEVVSGVGESDRVVLVSVAQLQQQQQEMQDRMRSRNNMLGGGQQNRGGGR